MDNRFAKTYPPQKKATTKFVVGLDHATFVVTVDGAWIAPSAAEKFDGLEGLTSKEC